MKLMTALRCGYGRALVVAAHTCVGRIIGFTASGAQRLRWQGVVAEPGMDVRRRQWPELVRCRPHPAVLGAGRTPALGAASPPWGAAVRASDAARREHVGLHRDVVGDVAELPGAAPVAGGAAGAHSGAR